jgi:hypothetical protein
LTASSSSSPAAAAAAAAAAFFVDHEPKKGREVSRWKENALMVSGTAADYGSVEP